MLREEKFSDEEIAKKLSNHRMADGSKLSKAYIQRLGNLRLRYDEDYSGSRRPYARHRHTPPRCDCALIYGSESR
jgi:hypothetical protein